jgi:hypothetical protein
MVVEGERVRKNAKRGKGRGRGKQPVSSRQNTCMQRRDARARPPQGWRVGGGSGLRTMGRNAVGSSPVAAPGELIMRPCLFDQLLYVFSVLFLQELCSSCCSQCQQQVHPVQLTHLLHHGNGSLMGRPARHAAKIINTSANTRWQTET